MSHYYCYSHNIKRYDYELLHIRVHIVLYGYVQSAYCFNLKILKYHTYKNTNISKSVNEVQYKALCPDRGPRAKFGPLFDVFCAL